MTKNKLIFTHRLAQFSDLPAIGDLMLAAITENMKAYLSKAQIEAAKESMGIDTSLIEDQTYFVIEAKVDGIDRIVACGGWGKRRTLFGGNHTQGRDDSLSDPATEPARVRAMYTHPDWIRKGIGKKLIQLAEKSARDYGFKQIELGSTIAGHEFYLKQGYRDIEKYERRSSNGEIDIIIKMRKSL